MRIGHIVHGDPHARKRPVRSLVLGAFALTFGAGLVAVHAASMTPTDVDFTGPIISGRISSPYGLVRASLSTQPHHGVDLAGARGTPVMSPAAGMVLIATETYEPPSYGTVIVIDHGNEWQTVYAHLDSLDVTVGDRVDRGQQIGRLGSTGKATGPHVHVELRRHGERVDPASIIGSLVAAP
jgi:murein DD-endopeptidase MepM/ murein hydrolase activator NlpD